MKRGLLHHGWDIVECHTEASGFFAKCTDLYTQWKRCHCDALLVMYPGQYLVPLAWIFARIRGVPILFDAFISLYDTKVHDRAQVAPRSLRALALWSVDWMSCRFPDLVLLDTPEHASFFSNTFHLSSRRALSLYIGADIDWFFPRERRRKEDAIFTVLFHGSFIPLQGIEVIVHAAHILEQRGEIMCFDILGSGQTYAAMEELVALLNVRSVHLRGACTTEQIVDALAACDVALGIFGLSAKADRVIPHKAYQIIACARPLVTGDTSSARAIFTHGIDAMLTKPGDPHGLAAAILFLRDHEERRLSIADAGYRLSLERFQPQTIVEPLVAWLSNYCHAGYQCS